jgi:hypothetical protein
LIGSNPKRHGGHKKMKQEKQTETQTSNTEQEHTQRIELIPETLIISKNVFDKEAKSNQKKLFYDIHYTRKAEQHQNIKAGDLLVNIGLIRNDNTTRKVSDELTAELVREKLKINNVVWN